MPIVAFLPLLSAEDAIISDELNHTYILDGIRLYKAGHFRFDHNNMEDLVNQLKQAESCKRKLIVTNGSFSMDETIAQLDKICDSADKNNTLVMIVECNRRAFLENRESFP